VTAGRSPFGAVAQLGERELCKLEVIGSIPFSSTNIKLRTGTKLEAEERWFFAFCLRLIARKGMG
jgi:hypothetical protein